MQTLLTSPSTDQEAAALPLWLATEQDYEGLLASLPPTASTWARAQAFAPERQRTLAVPGTDGGTSGALLGLGALATLLIFHDELNIYSFVGIIMLIGIVKKNAIMMIDFALEAQRTHHMAPSEAIFEACLVRFRPIMMTTMAALVGTLPIALGLGSGSEARRPLGLAVVGGLVVSQLLTLYITPVFYIYMDRVRHSVARKKVDPTPEHAVGLGH